MPNIASLRRGDILREYEGVLGDYSSTPWIESADVSSVRVAVHFHSTSPTPYVEIEEAIAGSNDGAYPVRKVEIPVSGAYAYGEVNLVGRVFKLAISGDTSTLIQAVIRIAQEG